MYVATVGRLLECIEREYIKIDECDCLIVDEADKFPKVAADKQSWQDVNKVAGMVQGAKAAFSATFKSLHQIHQLVPNATFIDCTKSQQLLQQLPHIT